MRKLFLTAAAAIVLAACTSTAPSGSTPELVPPPASGPGTLAPDTTDPSVVY